MNQIKKLDLLPRFVRSKKYNSQCFKKKQIQSIHYNDI